MPTCPNCGSYIPLGNHSCSCGTTISYDYDEEDNSIDWYEMRKKDRMRTLMRMISSMNSTISLYLPIL